MPSFQDAVSTAKRLYEAGRLPEAEQLYLQILGANPNWAEGHAAVSRIFFETKRFPLAIAAMQTAITHRPADLPSCYNNLGVLLHEAGKFSDAADAFRKAIALVPRYAIAHRNLGDSLRPLEQSDAAEQSYLQALRLDPRMGDCHVGLGLVFYFRSQYLKAIAHLEKAVRMNPQDPDAYRNLVPCHLKLGDAEAVEKNVRRIMELLPNEPEHHSALLMFLNYIKGADLPVVLNESREFNRRHVLPLAGALQPHDNNRDPDRPLRIGYISPDFRKHSVANFLVPVLIHHDRRQFQISCYAQVEAPDEVTAGFQTHVDRWCPTVGLTHEQVAEQIRADGIDILIDLAGHSVDNRLPVLARKPAPVQVTWLGYPNTTGVDTIDYRLTDWHADPRGSDEYYTEKLIRLPEAFFAYETPNVSPPVSPLPMLECGHVTFASFNNIIKITPDVAHAWAEILRAIPGARLLIAGVPVDAHARMRRMIDGIADDRVEMVDFTGFQQYLHLHHRVDIALDPYPWAGHTTSCHSLWMGVPVVSQAGPTAVSRAGVSIMANLGMAADWIANTPEEYIRIAKNWAGRPDDLNALRQGLRDRLLASPLTDAGRFTRNFEKQLRQLWQAWV